MSIIFTLNIKKSKFIILAIEEIKNDLENIKSHISNNDDSSTDNKQEIALNIEYLKKKLKFENNQKDNTHFASLIKNVIFENTDKDAEEEEHSIEMQLPFLVKVLSVENFTLIPILVGSLDHFLETLYAHIL